MTVATLRPNAAGDLTELTLVGADTNWQAVAEAVADDDTSFVHSNIGGVYGTWYQDSHNLENLPSGVEVITNVRVVVRVRRVAVNPDTNWGVPFYWGVRISSTNYETFDDVQETYAVFNYDLATNPNTGVAWTVSDINSLQAHIRGRRYNNSWALGGNNVYANFTQLYVEVTYIVLSTVTTQAVTAISGTTATGNGNITSLGTPNPTAHGVCWKVYVSAASPPTISDSVVDNGAASATGAFTGAMTGLTAGVKYGVRAYATNAAGTSYGAQVIFWANKGTVHPSDDVARVSSIRHIFQPGMFRMEVAVGDLGFDVDVAEATVRKELDTAKEVEKAEAGPLVPKTTEPAPIKPIEPLPPGTVIVPLPKPKLPMVTDKVTPIMPGFPMPKPKPEPKPGELTERAKDVLRKNEQAARLLTEMQRLTTSAKAIGITSYARQVLIKRAIEIKQQIETLNRSR